MMQNVDDPDTMRFISTIYFLSEIDGKKHQSELTGA